MASFLKALAGTFENPLNGGVARAATGSRSDQIAMALYIVAFTVLDQDVMDFAGPLGARDEYASRLATYLGKTGAPPVLERTPDDDTAFTIYRFHRFDRACILAVRHDGEDTENGIPYHRYWAQIVLTPQKAQWGREDPLHPGGESLAFELAEEVTRWDEAQTVDAGSMF
ncbi:MAG: hypothetical protein AAFR73_12040 [Pseudomonadota bacterium]